MRLILVQKYTFYNNGGGLFYFPFTAKKQPHNTVVISA